MLSRHRSEGFLPKPSTQPKYTLNLPFRINQLQVQLRDQQNEERHLSPPKAPVIPSTDLNLLKEPNISVYISLKKASERRPANNHSRRNSNGNSDSLNVSEFCQILKTMHRRRDSATNYNSIESALPPIIDEESSIIEPTHKRSVSLPTINKAKKMSCDSSEHDTTKSTVETLALRSSYLRPSKAKPIRLVKEILDSNTRKAGNYPLSRVLSSKEAIESVYNYLDSQQQQQAKVKSQNSFVTGEQLKALNLSQVFAGGSGDESGSSSRVGSNKAVYYKNREAPRTNNIYQMKALVKDMSFSKLKMEILSQKKNTVRDSDFVNSYVPILSSRREVDRWN